MTLWLVRHAQVLAPVGTCYGVSDFDADASATQDAAQRLSRELPQGLPLRTSPLRRCRQLTNALVAIRPDLQATADDRLVEMNFGSYEGRLWRDIGKDAMDVWTADFWYYRFGGAQSVAEFMASVAAAWDDHGASNGDAIWVTHAGVIRACSLLAQGRRDQLQAHEWPANVVETSGLVRL
jgi:alpha-ribazole phosphatase